MEVKMVGGKNGWRKVVLWQRNFLVDFAFTCLFAVSGMDLNTVLGLNLMDWL
ncbi:hypothetical protein ACSAZL_03660 [Methanosarcina sp. T3]|uniref:hypothetical protein n=1 Tax=Methanosarcina sp. T3 TaxID=3439062 RepID=UPI003F851AFD